MDGMPAEGSALPSVGDEIAAKYRIESVLGQGGMGAVYAARNKLTGKRVAIKWLLPEHAGSSTRERLLREAQIASSIEHPNVVDIYDVGEHEGGLFLVMEYLRGKNLADVLAEAGRLDPEQLIALLVPAMRGVHAAHQAGVIHRDLKPDNIILSEQDGKIVPKVVDFGVSKTLGASAVPASSLTRTGALVGTPHYMALEQVDGSNAIDERTDVYAFGVLLYRALTGHFPFDGTTLGEVILKIGTKDAAPMRMLRPELPAALDTVVLRALSRDRTKRLRDLEELARALAPFTPMRPGEPIEITSLPGAALRNPLSSTEHSQTGAMAAARPTPPIERQLRRRRAVWAGVATGLVLMVVAGWMVRRAPAPEGASLAEKPAAQELQDAPAAPVQAAIAPAAMPVVNEVIAPLAPASLQPVGSDMAAVAPSSSASVDAMVAPAVGAERALAEKPAAHAGRAEKTRVKANKPPLAARKTTTPASGVIPGERTNGLAIDDF